MAGVFVATAGSSIRYWQNLAEVYGRKATLIQSLARRANAELPDSEAERVLVDELRGLFRALIDVAAGEAARLEAELKQITTAFADTIEGAEPSAAYRRRWKVKE
jgi:hypothetical protein